MGFHSKSSGSGQRLKPKKAAARDKFKSKHALLIGAADVAIRLMLSFNGEREKAEQKFLNLARWRYRRDRPDEVEVKASNGRWTSLPRAIASWGEVGHSNHKE